MKAKRRMKHLGFFCLATLICLADGNGGGPSILAGRGADHQTFRGSHLLE